MSDDVILEQSPAEAFEIEGADDDGAAAPAVLAKDRRLLTEAGDPEIDSLYNRWKRGKLILQPDFQRYFVWDRVKASRLIESLLLEVPLPIIYLAEETDGTVAVIDGQQRLTSFFSFIDGTLPGGQKFDLRSLEVYTELNGTTYAQLPEDLQDRIRLYHIRVITIRRESNADVKFEIFRRLNTGAMPLNDMELRNCVYRGPYMELLKSLAEDAEFRALVGFQGTDRRMRDVELVLRFAAFYHTAYLHYQAPMKQFLNRDMERFQHMDATQRKDLEKAFKNALQIIMSLFGERAFHRFTRGEDGRPNGDWETRRFNASLYDVLMGTFCRRDKALVHAALDSIREGILDLMASDSEFIDAILLGTSEPRRVVKRFDLMRMRVDAIMDDYPRQPRCFSLNLKKELFEHDATCAICGQQIQQLDDAAVDHIKQYWQGGRTIPENARLTHRYCNWARSRAE